MAWKLGVGFSVMKKVFGGKRAFESGEDVLSSNTVTYKN
jgi:hypothetical protein